MNSLSVSAACVPRPRPKINIEQVKILLDESYKRAWECLEKNRSHLDSLADALLKHETLTGSQIKDVLAGKKIDVADSNQSRPAAARVPNRPVPAAGTAGATAPATKDSAT